MSESLPVIVLGGSGYVAGEVLALLAGHPRLELAYAVSASRPGQRIASAFSHLSAVYPEARFASLDETIDALSQAPRWIVISAAPHGVSASIVAKILESAGGAGVQMSVVDASADFRSRSAERFESVYGTAHEAPQLLDAFSCAVPEHLNTLSTPHAAQPGCFATAMLLALVPLVSLGAAEPSFFASAVTGSTGAGRTPRETTHHPLRQSNLFAYRPLIHRHAPEVCELAQAATGQEIKLHFVPHSGPFARGIHATVFAEPAGSSGMGDITSALADFYRDSSFVRVVESPPRLKDIVGTNNALLSVHRDAGAIAVCCVLDNLVKGAAGGAIQWVNRLAGWPDTTGLPIAPVGWV